jgi:two-component system cell cycle sensor histidine kinase/response regulator CckA
MESVGRLAGGVAHDFNNMLGAILGYTELGMMAVSPADPIHGRLKDIQKAAKRSPISPGSSWLLPASRPWRPRCSI